MFTFLPESKLASVLVFLFSIRGFALSSNNVLVKKQNFYKSNFAPNHRLSKIYFDASNIFIYFK